MTFLVIIFSIIPKTVGEKHSRPFAARGQARTPAHSAHAPPDLAHRKLTNPFTTGSNRSSQPMNS